MKKVLIVFSCFDPPLSLMECIKNLYNIQITDEFQYKIICVDNDSEITTTYDIINNVFPEVEICYVKNKNYEWGAYKYAKEIFHFFDIYMCLQDTIVITKKIDISLIKENEVFSIFHKSGFFSHPCIKNRKNLERFLKNTNLDVKGIIDTRFILSQHNTFIISKRNLDIMYETLKNPPICKLDTNFYERLYGLYFIIKKIKTINLEPYVKKIPRGPERRYINEYNMLYK